MLALADATYAQFVAVPAANIAHLPDGLDPVDAAAIPLVTATGEQLVRLATQASAGQTIVVTGALGGGRTAVYAAGKLGVGVVAGVRGRQLAKAEALGTFRTLALDDDDAIARLDAVDGVADTIGGETGATLFGKVRKGGRFGYASMLPDGVAARYPDVEVSRIFARPDPQRLRAFANDVRDGSSCCRSAGAFR